VLTWHINVYCACQVGNAIGKGNRHYFVVFLWLELYSMAVSGVVAIIQIRHHVVGEAWSASGLVRREWAVGTQKLL
jgi:hypothetical protein